jgi:hypothetical protein
MSAKEAKINASTNGNQDLVSYVNSLLYPRHYYTTQPECPKAESFTSVYEKFRDELGEAKGNEMEVHLNGNSTVLAVRLLLIEETGYINVGLSSGFVEPTAQAASRHGEYYLKPDDVSMIISKSTGYERDLQAKDEALVALEGLLEETKTVFGKVEERQKHHPLVRRVLDLVKPI